ncbi:MAG TPA: hypothetical protein VF637_00995 [Sphingomicrobium sp.]|jgi:hypothetical protein
MGNENERKHDPAENRQEWMGGGPDTAKKGGGNESNVGLTGPSGGEGGMGAGSGGVIGGSADFLTDPAPATQATQDAPVTGGQRSHESEYGLREAGSGVQHNMTDQQGGDTSFGGRTGAGSSFLASDTGQSDLGSAGVSPQGDDEQDPRADSKSN